MFYTLRVISIIKLSCILSVLTVNICKSTTFSFIYKETPITFNHSFNTADYTYYKNKSKYGQNMAFYAEQENSHPYLAGLSAQLRQIAQRHGWYRSKERDMVIRFVQQAIKYKTDPANNGYDYPRYPIETLYERVGDCEDKSCLLVALLKTMGYDAVLLQFPGHIAAGVVAPDIKGTYYAVNNKSYYYVESTGIYPPGKNPGYKSAEIKVVNQTAWLQPTLYNENNVSAKQVAFTDKQPAKQVIYYTHATGRTVVKYSMRYEMRVRR